MKICFAFLQLAINEISVEKKIKEIDIERGFNKRERFRFPREYFNNERR